MRKIAIYGKGGIGKSTIVSNLSVALAEKGWTVLQIGCDPKADSTYYVRNKKPLKTVLDVMRERKNDFTLDDICTQGYRGVWCLEAGGPVPGLGCAGRGIMTALEKIEEKGLYEKIKPDVIFYDVLGDVVCGGFTQPMRKGYAQEVYIITSGENMSIYAAANIATAIGNFKGRGYASLGGLILNERNVPREAEKAEELSRDFETNISGRIPRSDRFSMSEEQGMTLMEAFPESEEAELFRNLAEQLIG